MKKRMVCGWMAAALAAWTLHAAAAQPKLTGIEFQSSPAGVTVSGQGEAGTAYTLQWSERLGTQENWQEASEATAKADGTFTALDQTFCKPGFYRVERKGGAGGHKGIQLWEGGPYWAETNIGAEEPWEYGLYFWWGDTVGYRREGSTWVASDGSSTNFSFNENNTPTYRKNNATLQSEGWITPEGALAPAHDAAQVHWGGGWRMPTDSEFSALLSNCDWTWTATNGVNGYVVRGKGDYASASIFLPAAGRGDGASLDYSASYGHGWSSTPSSSYSGLAWSLGFYSGYFSRDDRRRYYGFSVRALRGFAE